MKNNFKIFIFVVLFFVGLYFYIVYQNKITEKIPKVCNRITEVQALKTVNDLPEVKEFFKLNFPEGNKPILQLDHKTKNGSSVIQVYESVKDSQTTVHSATFNWYLIDSCTGKINCSFIIYNKGKRVGVSEENECSFE